MNKLLALPLMLALAAFCSCQKKQSEASEKTLKTKEVAQPKNGSLADQPTASYTMFFTRLERYGVWRETAVYGYVWQPIEAERSRNWRPYTNGHWIYSDVGWAWISEEPFGWAAYHYGRWIRLRHIGWVWVPGEEWAPAWVSWRKNDDYIGWAPLPPEARFDRRVGIRNWADNYYDIGPDQYCFVPANQFGAQRVSARIVSPERNLSIVNQTTNVTKITYNNKSIVNQGPDYYELRARTQQPIELLRVVRRTAFDPLGENPRPLVKGEVIEMPAPTIAKQRLTERPRHLKETMAHATIDRGWEMVADFEAAEKVRAKIKSESAPPEDAPPKTFVKPGAAESQAVSSVP